MHSSRMRTARALTIGGGGWCIPEEFFGGKKIEGKKKFGDPPEKLDTPPTPRTIGYTPGKIGDTPPCEQTSHTPVKI